VRELFATVPRSVSLKGALGHTLGASGPRSSRCSSRASRADACPRPGDSRSRTTSSAWRLPAATPKGCDACSSISRVRRKRDEPRSGKSGLNVYLLAPTVLRVAQEDLPARWRALRGRAAPRRRLRAALPARRASLPGRRGRRRPARGPVGERVRRRARHARRARRGLEARRAAMPFTFIAMQPHLAGALLAQRSHPVTRTACLYLPRMPGPAARLRSPGSRNVSGFWSAGGGIRLRRRAHRSDCAVSEKTRRGAFAANARAFRKTQPPRPARTGSPASRLARFRPCAAPSARRRRRVELYSHAEKTASGKPT